MSLIMVIDLKKCIGCNACANNCKQEHGTPPGITRAKVVKKEEGVYPTCTRISLPLLCMHCENAPCVDACPSGASQRDPQTGVVTADKDQCIGCKACIVACPYGARYYRADNKGYFGDTLTPYEQVMYKDMPKGVVDKCDFCADRRRQGLEPACVQSCIAGARYFGEKEDLFELIKRRNGYQLRPELGTNPSVWYLP